MFDVFYTGPKPGLFAFEQPADSLSDAAEKSNTVGFWYINGNNDYTDFDFDWRPAPWDREYVHVFPSQWQNNGDVWFAFKETAADCRIKFVSGQAVKRLPSKDNWIIPSNIDCSTFDFSWHPDPHEEPYEYHFPTQWHKHGGPIYRGTAGIKYVHRQRVRSMAPQIFYMDFLNPESKENLEHLKTKWPNIKVTRYVDSHLNVFKRIGNIAATGHVWIISSICDYSNFDFTWHPDQWKENMLHVFPSGNQTRGDTFFMNVDAFAQQMNNIDLLDWYNVINYCNDQQVQRYPAPVVNYTQDKLLETVKGYNFKYPYVIITNKDTNITDTDICLWREKDRTVLSYSLSNSTALVPRDVKSYLNTQIYDYPYVIKTQTIDTDQDLDIVYISNGEVDEERWYQRTCEVSKRQVKWIRGVNGRTAAYQSAARASDTPWFFTVFAKLEVTDTFNWTWQPDYFQEPKHYIFNARNPVNRLEYGHMGVIAYNKNLVLANNNPGIDFTLSQPHESVPVLSATAHFNAEPWMAWRTAFREVLKLKYFNETQPTVETAYRLNTWLTRAEGLNADWVLKGAQDAVEYYREVAGDYAQLLNSFDWAWLRTRFNIKDI